MKFGGRSFAKVTDVLANEAREANLGFLTRVTKGRPSVTLKLATTLDGKIATITGDSQNLDQTITGISDTITLNMASVVFSSAGATSTLEVYIDSVATGTTISLDTNDNADFDVNPNENVKFEVANGDASYNVSISITNQSDGGTALDSFACTN